MIEIINKLVSAWNLFKVDFILLCYKYFGGLRAMKFSLANHVGSNITFLFSRGANVKLGKHIGLRDDVFPLGEERGIFIPWR